MNQKIEEAVHSLVTVIYQQLQSQAAHALLVSLGEETGAVDECPSASSRPSKPAKLRKGQKRDPEALAQLVEKLFATIKNYPGTGIEEIGSRMGEPTKDLALPVRKLIKARRIKTKGQKRATRYFPRG